MRTGIILLLLALPALCLGNSAEGPTRRFQVSVEVKGNQDTYVATLKDAWGSYLAFREGAGWGKTVFENVPPGDFSLRVEFGDGTHIWRSVRVDAVLAGKKREIPVSLSHSDAVATVDSLETTHSVSTDELAVTKEAKKLFRTAWASMEIGDWAAARSQFDEAIEIAPGFFDAWNNAGVVARKQNDIEGAEAYFRRAVVLRPDSFEVNINLGEVLAEKKKLDEAIRYARRAHRIRPDDPIANAQLGMHLFHAMRFEECISYLENVARNDPKSFYYPQILLAAAYESLDKPFNALEQVEHWLKHHETNPDRPTVEAKKKELERKVNVLEEVSAQ